LKVGCRVGNDRRKRKVVAEIENISRCWMPRMR
jgi:hypothetical protein